MTIEILEDVILVLHVLAALAIIGVVMLQRGKGAEMGAGFGGGSSNTVFGSAGSGNFLTRITTIVATVFFVTSFSLAYFAKERAEATAQLGIPEVPVTQVVTEAPGELALPDLDGEMQMPARTADLQGGGEIPTGGSSGSDSELPDLD